MRGAVGLVQAIEAAFALAAGIAGVDHRLDTRDVAIDDVKGIIRGQSFSEAAGDVGEKIDADQIGQTENTGLGDAERAAHGRGRLPRLEYWHRTLR